MKHIVFYSGGLCSYSCAKRVVQQYGAENTILLFTDTLIEDEDCYRFINETALKMGVELVQIADGRTPFEVYKDRRLLGNSRIAPCTHELKHKPAKKWIKEHFAPNECILYLGLDWTETHRFAAPRKNWAPYTVEYPMGEEPYLSREDMLEELRADGIAPPRLYAMGFAHNNCGGFCCRAGQGHFANLLKVMPERFAHYENKEEEMRQYLGRDVAMMKRTVKGVVKPYTLKQLREDIEKEQQIDMLDIGGCACFSSDDAL